MAVWLYEGQGWLHRASDSIHNPIEILLDLVFPDSKHPPALPAQAAEVSVVPLPRRLDLVSPEARNGVSPSWKAVAVPKVTIEKYGHAGAGKHNVWFTW